MVANVPPLVLLVTLVDHIPVPLSKAARQRPLEKSRHIPLKVTGYT